MKNTILIIAIIATFISCKNTDSNENKVKTITEIAKLSAANLKIDSFKKAGKIIIFSEDEYVIAYNKEEVDKLENVFTKYILAKPLNPGSAYEEYIFNVPNELLVEIDNVFSSESGQDEFCLVYTYFLKQKNGVDKFSEERKQLISIFNIINSYNSVLVMGGTMYGHRQSRLYADVEYAIYESNNKKTEKTGEDFIKQKEKFIKQLKDIVKYDFKIDDKQREINLFKSIESLNNEITNLFYLEKAIEFQKFYE